MFASASRAFFIPPSFLPLGMLRSFSTIGRIRILLDKNPKRVLCLQTAPALPPAHGRMYPASPPG